MLGSEYLDYESERVNQRRITRANVTKVLQISRETSKCTSFEICRGSRDAAFRNAQFERAKYEATDYRFETRLEVSQITVGPDMIGRSISHPAGPSQSSASARTPIPLPAIGSGDSGK